MTNPTGILPYHPHPRDDELFTSWLTQLAIGNGFKLSTFTKLTLSQYVVWTRDIDRSAPDGMLSILSDKTGISQNRLLQTTLRAYECYAFEHYNPTGGTLLICPLGIWHTRRKQYGLAYCPACLEETYSRPLFKRVWRLAVSVTCSKHLLQLYDCCQKCGAPVAYHLHDFFDRNSFYRESIARCYNCYTPLFECEWKLEKSVSLIEFQQSLETMLRVGWISIQDTPVYSFQYLKVLRNLMWMFLSKRKIPNKFREYCLKQAKMAFDIKDAYQEFEKARIIARRQALNITLWSLEDWPTKFVEIATAANSPRSLFLRDMKYTPYWFDKVLLEHLERRFPEATWGEIEQAINYLRRNNIKVNKKNLLALMGFTDSKNIVKYIASLK